MTTSISPGNRLRWLALLPALLLGGCRGGEIAPSASPPPASAGFPVTVTDDSGRKVTFSAPPQRIVSVAPAHTETLYALGLGDRVMAADTYSDYPLEAKAKATLNCWPRPPVEQIVALQPDLVVALTQEETLLKPMEAAKIPALKLFPQSYEKALEEILLLGKITGTEAAARKLVDGMRARTRAVQDRVAGARRVRVLYELDATDPNRPYVAGSGGFYGELLPLAGGENIFADLRVSTGPVSSEQIVARRPEVILLGDTRSPQAPQSPDTVGKRPGWSAIPAVRSGRVHAVNSDLITRAGPRLVEGLEVIARRLHPNRFSGQ